MRTYEPPWFRPYDPADSPGPIPSVVERFRRRGLDEEPQPSEAERQASRHTVVLVSHDHVKFGWLWPARLYVIMGWPRGMVKWGLGLRC